MKKLVVVVMMFCVVRGFGQTGFAQTKKSKKTTGAAAVTAQTITIPKDAILGQDGSYHYTDKQGKKWLYRNTPFGVSRTVDEGPKAAVQTADAVERTKATVVGDTVKFERPSAFGVARWEKKTADLTEDEKKIVDNQKAKQE